MCNTVNTASGGISCRFDEGINGWLYFVQPTNLTTAMKFTTSLTTLSFALSLSTIAFVNAAPIATRDVYVPPIVTPVENEVWQIGQNRTVTWSAPTSFRSYYSPHTRIRNTTSPTPPTNITNPIGKIMLRKGARTLLNSMFPYVSTSNRHPQ